VVCIRKRGTNVPRVAERAAERAVRGRGVGGGVCIPSLVSARLPEEVVVGDTGARRQTRGVLLAAARVAERVVVRGGRKGSRACTPGRVSVWCAASRGCLGGRRIGTLLSRSLRSCATPPSPSRFHFLQTIGPQKAALSPCGGW
jgi:hypothetical protein